ncbi:MAG: A/G-specific adenine glycosylase [Chloroflexi bacterium HGW-Chloroflexi-4]|jgi:A/G-specific adenine glycosylase|nr:MAG: A/G-specific adenine glycosylase [Chloroflexi bacterium HGW-Chloroflexi-4]
MNAEFGRRLISWYAIHARPMPWRSKTDAYSIWVSEIMLQQTQVNTVIPYYESWMRKFPTVQALAAANEHEVLNAWEGLGYYSRARNMLKSARIVIENLQGQFPSSAADLVKLPGIGRYTAAAISSIAFGANEAVLDGNVKRVLSRVFEISEEVNTPEGEKKLWLLAAELLPKGEASAYNQAVMDLGATICTPKSPDCTGCPVNSICSSYKNNSQDNFPVMREKQPVPHINVVAAIIRQNGLVLIARRPSKGLLGGLWEFPGGKLEEGESHAEALVREIREELGCDVIATRKCGDYRHAYTHFKVTLEAWFAEINGDQPSALEASEIRWVKIEDLGNYPMGKIDRSISNDLMKNEK